ncbi:MAG: hypothetical protein RL757_2059 [Bacteroidota bacterium]|jgi:hypothetical protein
MNFRLSFLFLFFCNILQAQNMFTLSGYVRDAKTNETLVGANIYNKEKIVQGTISNPYGFYSLTLPQGEYKIVFSFIGYPNKEVIVDLNKNQILNAEMSEGVQMEEFVVTAKQADENVSSTKMGTVTVAAELTKKLPALMGEADILKTIQLIPGVKATEGSSGFYVRGGGPDQNLVLLDEAVVYSPGHLLGFFSIFNADAIKNTTLIKGNMPAQYGGRLSSVVDIQMKEGNNKTFGVDGGIGLIASRLTVEGPIQKEKSSFIISARRTYVLDLLQPYINTTRFAGTNYYFYDLNAKVNYQISEKDRVYLSGYFGRDIFSFNSKTQGFGFKMPYGNATGTLRWNHVFNPKLFANISAIYNDYDFAIGGGQDVFQFKLSSGIRDWNGKIDFDYSPNYRNAVKFGVNYTFHRLTPSVVTATNGQEQFSNNLKPKLAHEIATYINDDYKITDDLSLYLGLRGGVFTHVGPYKAFKSNEIVKSYPFIEPRFSGKYAFNKQNSVKFGATFSNQFLHLVSNSTSTLPTDVWVPSTDVVRPQQGWQYALGYFRNFNDNMYEFSAEVYYRGLRNQIDYPDNYVQNGARDVEENFVFGSGRAYGLELFLKKSKGNLNGWIGYTLSKTERSFPDIENGRWYPATYDRVHDVVLVANYQISKKWELGGNFIYGTGSTFTPLLRLFLINQTFQRDYGSRNSARYSDYHRFDFAATFTPKPNSKKPFTSTWTFSVYNTYNRLNPFFVYYNIQSDLQAGTAKATALKVTLFPVIPSITWNFKFRQKPKSSDNKF